MEQRHKDKPIKLEPEENKLYTCPVCGYTDGFHVSFHFKNDSDGAEIILICPSCHQRFQIGWKVNIVKD